jgi:hypothetical protein
MTIEHDSDDETPAPPARNRDRQARGRPLAGEDEPLALPRYDGAVGAVERSSVRARLDPVERAPTGTFPRAGRSPARRSGS